MKSKKSKPYDPAAKTIRKIADRERRGVASSTFERVLRSGQEIDIGATGVQRFSAAPLDRLFQRKALTERQFHAGDQYRSDVYLSGMVASKSVNFGAVPGGGEGFSPGFMATTEKQASARRRWRAASKALGVRLTSIASEILVDSDAGRTMAQIGAQLLGRPEGKAAEAAIVEIARLLLDTLADHYENRPRRAA
jgi:hypothetical protein